MRLSLLHRATNFAMLFAFLPALAGAQSLTADKAMASAPATQPTAGRAAEAIAAEWQQASRKFDARRNALLAEVDRVGHTGSFRPDWQSLSQVSVPEWYKDAKFGIFIHWGLYSVPAYGSEWYPREMYREGSEINRHHVATYGPLTSFGYKDFLPRFRAEHYDPQAWARLFKQSGARYVVPVFEHHDGFAMYDSELSDWTAAKMGPHRDLVGDLAKAVRAEGLHLGASSHRIEHDWFLDGGRKQPSDVNDPRYSAFYGPAQVQLQDVENGDGNHLSTDWTYVSPQYGRDWVARNAEIVRKYKPEIFYFDWWIGQPSVRPYLAQFASYFYNESSSRGPVGVINYKLNAMQKHSGVLDLERGQLAEINPDYWQTDTSISNKSWGYIEHDTFKSPEFVVHQLIDIVSKNGSLLLNIGPRADGSIPDEVQQVLRSVGAWLAVNGDAIYGTRPWHIYGEGPTQVTAGPFHDTETTAFTAQDFRFTTKGGDLFAIALAWPQDGKATVKSLATGAKNSARVTSVRLLGSDAEVAFTQDASGLHMHLPARPTEEAAYAFRIRFAP